MKKEVLLKLLPYAVALAAFLLFAIIYCYPILEGKVIQQGDTISWQSMYQEAKTFNEKGEHTFWTGSMFSGMPTYQIGGVGIPSQNLTKPLYITHLFSKGVLFILISYFIGFFILLRAFKVNVWLSIFGAMAIALSSYFFIIIEAGHVTKAYGIGKLAAVIGGFYYIFNKKYLLGAIIVMIFSTMGLMSHPQMTFYLFMLIGVLYFAEVYTHVIEKRWRDLLIGTAIFTGCVLVGLGTSFPKIQLNREYVKETMRGGHSELTSDSDVKESGNGLDIDYATAWSYGVDETATLLIPNFMGGSSNYNVGTDSKIYDVLTENGVPKRQAADLSKGMPTYWGTQPFTSGPVYVGAIVFFLFVLGLIIVKGPYKWALLVATLFSIFLSWGKNFMPLTELFFNYFPMYNKFRAVSSILVVAEITIPLLAFLSLKSILNREVSKEKLMKGLYTAAGTVGGFCLLIVLLGSSFSFVSPNDAQFEGAYPDWLIRAIREERLSMLTSDALRSLVFILMGAGAIWMYISNKLKQAAFIPIIGFLMVIDLWAVDKRFFNEDAFVMKQDYANHFVKQPWEKMLESDLDPHFRIMNLTSNTFNDARSSYYYKSVGGYHAVKLRRYQDLIDAHISRQNMSVLNMLNTKYFIVQDSKGQAVPQLNQDAMGNAWFVDSLMVVSNPNEESNALYAMNVENTAVVDESKFGDYIKDFVPGNDPSAEVKFLTYEPNELTYEYSAAKDGTIVFSEVYYPYGWHAYIDEEPVEHFRVNYALRALNVPAGKHTIRFKFDPDTLRKSEPIAYASYAIMYGAILFGAASGVREYRRRRQQPDKKN